MHFCNYCREDAAIKRFWGMQSTTTMIKVTIQLNNQGGTPREKRGQGR